MEYKYIVMLKLENPGKKTSKYAVRSKSGHWLGRIEWFSRWRQYCFYPEAETVFNSGCLTDIQDFIDKLMSARRADRAINKPIKFQS